MILYGKKLRCIGSGLECRVYAIDRTRVLKLYSTKGERNRAFTRQSKAFKAGFGPAVYEKLDLDKGSFREGEELKFGYVSHRARSGHTVSEESLVKLRRAARKFGWRVEDIHPYNTGFVLMPVVVDFGDASLK